MNELEEVISTHTFKAEVEELAQRYYRETGLDIAACWIKAFRQVLDYQGFEIIERVAPILLFGKRL